MKRFRFRLRRLERWRGVLKREAELRLAAAIGAADLCGERVARLDRAFDDASRQLVERLAGNPVDGATLRADARSIEFARGARHAAQTQLEAAREEVEHRERECLETIRSHRVMTRLEERQHDRWRAEMERLEQRQLEELHRVRRTAGGEAGEAR